MPALQVREFPAEVYEQLKDYAAVHHRSVAQQTIVAVEEMLQRGLRLQPQPEERQPVQESAPGPSQRLARREAILRRADERRASIRIPNPSQMLHEERASREERLLDVLRDEGVMGR